MEEVVSVIIPIYNVERYLRRCIESVLRQTYKSLEIILVNDGSTDGCASICDEFIEKDNRIKVIHKKNGGLSDARNVGIKRAIGSYIALIDSDDWVEENYIEKLYSNLIKYNAEISVCNFIKTYSEKNETINNNKHFTITELTNVNAMEELYGELSSFLFVAWGKLYKKYLFEGIEYPYGKIHEDDFTTYKLLYKANKTIVTTEKLLYYWQREDSIMGKGFNPKNVLDLLEAYEERAIFLKQNKLIDVANLTYESILYIYIRIYIEIERFDGYINKKIFEQNMQKLKSILDNGEHKLKFKVIYRCFYMFPNFTKLIYRLGKKVNIYHIYNKCLNNK